MRRPVLVLASCLVVLAVAPALSHAQSTFIVTSTADAGDADPSDGVCDTDDSAGDGPCTLRAAIEQANATANADASTPDRIEFDIPGSGPHVIEPASYRPQVDEAVVMDGTTEPDYSGSPVVVLDGAPNDRDVGLVVGGQATTIRGLSVVGFNNQAIGLSGDGRHTVAGCWVGVHPDGTVPGNSGTGILINGNGINNTIGGPDASDRNIISGNGEEGIAGFGSVFRGTAVDGTVIQNNWIGLGADGVTAAGNGESGVVLTVGSGVQVLGNAIAGNGDRGMDGADLADAVVQGNRIGTSADGTLARANSRFAFECDGCSALQFGGTGTDERNLVGVGFVNLISDGDDIGDVVVEGNVIGLDVAGTAQASDGFGGGLILAGDFDAPRIGGASDAARNVIANSDGTGIDLDAYQGFGGTVQPGNGAVIQNNYVGLDGSGTAPRGHAEDGINILSGDGHQIIDNVVVAGTGPEDYWVGIDVGGNSSTTNDDAVVQGNRVGTRADGTGAFGGMGTGINCSFGRNAQIGGTGAGEGNRVVATIRNGLSVGCDGSVVRGNVVGKTADGTPAGTGRDGIYLPSIPVTPARITIGGTAAGAANVIAHSGRNGITVEKDDVIGNIQWVDEVTMRQNVIVGSGGVPIDLDRFTGESQGDKFVDGETPNDPGDDDTDAPNDLQNFPEFRRLDVDPATDEVTVEFTVDTAPTNATYPLTLEFFRANQAGRATGVLGSATIAESDAQTVQTRTFTAAASIARQDFVVATVTDAAGQTSEINPVIQTIDIAGSAPDGYRFDYPEVEVIATGPDNGAASLTLRNDLRDPENGPPAGTDLAIAGSWTLTTSGSVVLEEICLPLDNLINDPAGVNESALVVYSRTSATDDWIARATELQTIAGADYVCGSGPLGDEYIVAADPSDLPVELSRFDAVETDRGVRLDWVTASETNNAGFAVERRTPSGAFAEIGFVDGAGTASSVQRYDFVDADLPGGMESLTYRLRQVDTDGTAATGPSVTVDLSAPDRVALFGTAPNPVRQTADIRYTLPRPADVRLAVYDALGRQVAVLASGQQSPGRKTAHFDASGLPSGMYFIRLSAAGATQTRRVAIVR